MPEQIGNKCEHIIDFYGAINGGDIVCIIKYLIYIILIYYLIK